METKETNYIDEVLDEFDKKQFLGISHGGFMANNRKEENKAISNFIKQKLQEVITQERERIKDEFALMKNYTGSSFEIKDLRINLKEAVDIVNFTN